MVPLYRQEHGKTVARQCHWFDSRGVYAGGGEAGGGRVGHVDLESDQTAAVQTAARVRREERARAMRAAEDGLVAARAPRPAARVRASDLTPSLIVRTVPGLCLASQDLGDAPLVRCLARPQLTCAATTAAGAGGTTNHNVVYVYTWVGDRSCRLTDVDAPTRLPGRRSTRRGVIPCAEGAPG